MSRPDRRRALKLLGAGAMAAPLAACATPVVRNAAARRPNILFIMTDDHAQSALSSYGATLLKTPNLDRIGAEGVRFTEAFVTNSLCLPSRASYLTGQYSHTHGLMTNGEESGFTSEPRLKHEQTWPVILRAAGYHTVVIGKWHVNTPPEGYDHAAVLPGQGMYFDPEMLVNGRMTRQQGHTDDVIGTHAAEYLRTLPKDCPFAMLCQFKAPHRGWEPAPRFARMFEDVEVPSPPSLYEDIGSRPYGVRKSDMLLGNMADFRNRGVSADLPYAERARRNYQMFIKNYYRVLLGVDENVGRLLETLDRAGLSENTVVVYTTDNGFFLGEHGMFDKRLMYEESIRVPMLVRYPGAVAPGQVNREHMVLNIDVAPSFLDLAGAAAPATMQGASWAPVVRGQRPAWRQDFLYEYYEFPAAHCVRRHRGVRNRRWKLIHWDQPEEYELYDLENDPSETFNLARRGEYAGVQTTLRGRLMELRRQYADTGQLSDPPPPERWTCPT